MKIATAYSTHSDTSQAVHACYHSLQQELGGAPSLLLVYSSVAYDLPTIQKALLELAPGVPFAGGTSCMGVMTEAGFHSRDGMGLGLLGFSDPQGNYGIGAARIGSNGRAAGAAAIQQAVESAIRPGELPDLVWLIGTPGHEENVLQGIQDVIGKGTPIFGGSAADNTVEGHWHQFTSEEILGDGALIVAMYPSAVIHYVFHNGYFTSVHSGTATRAEGHTLYAIDGKPAAQVYNEWSNGVISGQMTGGNVLALTTLHPLGRLVGQVGGVPYYRLLHPDSVTPDGGLTLFAAIESGEELVMMSGTREGLVSRPGQITRSALETSRLTPLQISGALVTYCAGCILTVQDQMFQVAAEIRNALGGKPFLGSFTFGEQGCFLGGENHHGNLMFSIVLFEG